MIFCLGDGKYESKGEGYQKNLRIFNIEVSEDEWSKARNATPKFELPIAKWVDKKYMTKEEKENWTSCNQTGGFLKTLSYQNAWAEAWPKASDAFKKWVKDLPHFDAEIFEKITGQKIDSPLSLKGKEVEVKLDGVSYKAIIQ